MQYFNGQFVNKYTQCIRVFFTAIPVHTPNTGTTAERYTHTILITIHAGYKNTLKLANTFARARVWYVWLHSHT